MPPATRKKSKIAVLKDENADVEPPAAAIKRKRAREEEDEQFAAARKRSALGDKSCNSTDHSIRKLGTIKTEPEEDDFKKPAIRKKSLLGHESRRKEEPEDGMQPLMEYLAKEFSGEEYERLFRLLEVPDATAYQEAANMISSRYCWTAELLEAFENSGITNLNLSTEAPPPGEHRLLDQRFTLKPLFVQGRWEKLSTLVLQNTRLEDDDVALLRVLPALEILDLRSTGITNQALHHLVCHRHTLKTLNISLNSHITNEARFILRALPQLTVLFLRGTSFTLPGIRNLVLEDLNKGCRLYSLPAPVLEYIARRDKSIVDIPAGYVTDPDPQKIANMTLPNLKKNLQLHAKFNKDLQITGTKPELVHRLSVVLRNYAADTRIVEILGRKAA